MKKWIVVGCLMIVLGGIWLVFGNEKEQSVVAEKRISFISPMANSGGMWQEVFGIWGLPVKWMLNVWDFLN